MKHLWGRFVGIFILFFLYVILFSSIALTEGILSIGNYEYVINDDSSIRITNYLGFASSLSIPSKINGHLVLVLVTEHSRDVQA